MAAALDELQEMLARVCSLPLPADDHERIDRIVALDRLAAGVAAAQAGAVVDLDAARRAREAAAGVPAARRGRGVPEEIALARKVSPSSASRHLTRSQVLCRDLPAAFGLLATGQLSGWTAEILAREVAVLDPPERRLVDARLAPDLPGWSPRQAEAAVRRAVAEVDAAAVVRRRARARDDRRVSLRPAPDTMSVLSALLPVEQGVAAWASLEAHARALKATGDPRSVDAIRADTLVERVTGQATADAVPVEVHLVMAADTLLDPDDETAGSMLGGLAPVPADLARRLATRAADTSTHTDGDSDRAAATTWIRRLFTDPVTGVAIELDPRRRLFPPAVARFVRARDQVCRVPYCTAPIRQTDHRTRYADGGPTDVANADGVCERHGQRKDEPGWSTTIDRGTGVVTYRTPTGHTYASHSPPALGVGARAPVHSYRSPLEVHLDGLTHHLAA